MSELAVLDTSIYIGHYRKGLYKKALLGLPYLVRNSSVVLAELYRGCRTDEERDRIGELEADLPVITPTQRNWLDSGRLLSRLSQKKGYSPEKLRMLHFDFLIALSARNIGATVITCDRDDFEEIRGLRDFKLVCWEESA